MLIWKWGWPNVCAPIKATTLDRVNVFLSIKLLSTSLPVMAKELRKNSMVDCPFPTGLGWTSAFCVL